MRTFGRPKKITCPRCGLKMDQGTPSCEDCGLIFERLSIATNRDAKRKIKRGERDYIIRTTTLPSDVKYWKLLLLVIFTGIMGGHHFRVGRYLKGSIYLAIFILTMLCVIFNSYIMAHFPQWMELVGALLIGPLAIAWIVDIVLVATKRYKVPIAIDLESEDIDDIIKQKR